MAPILPGLSDEPDLLRSVVLAAREAGATFLWWNVLNLRPGTREHFLERLARTGRSSWTGTSACTVRAPI